MSSTGRHYLSHSLFPEGGGWNLPSSKSNAPMSSPTIASADVDINNEQHDKIAVIASEYERVERLFNPSATIATTKSPIIHHVLLVGSGSNDAGPSKASTNDVDIEDYLSLRREFQKKVASSQRSGNFTRTDDDAGTVVVDRTNDGGKDGMMILREMTSRLEIAMVSCCERVIIPTTEEVVHRSRIIPVSPANWDDDDDIVVPGVVKKLDAMSSSSKVEPSSSPRNFDKLSSLPLDATNKSGILRIDKSMHFVKLLVMNCYDVNHRAMAIAILQRTIECEISTIDHPQINKNSMSKLFHVNSTDDDDHGEQRIINTIGLLNTELKQSFSLNAKRTKSFLAAGGLRLLAQWLVDSYTVVSAPSNPVNPIKGGTVAQQQQQQQQQQSNVQHIASPTGCILLPLLHLLKFVPFDKKVVIESQIHKYIKRLKKSLSAVVEGFDSTLDNNTVHPIAGGLSVRKVIAYIDTVMSVWKRAAAASPSIDDDHHPTTSLTINNTFDELQKRVKQRFDYLEQMQSKAGNPAWYMGKSIDSSLRSFLPNSATNNKLGLVRQNSVPVAVKSMEEDKQGASKKREGSPTVFESSKNPTKKHISWAPLPIKGED